VPASDVYIPARYFVRLQAVLEADGIDTEALLRPLNISAAGLKEPDAVIRSSHIDQLLQQVVKISRRTDLAFEVGSHATANSHSFVGFGMLSSASVDEALRFEARYFQLVMPSFAMRYSSGPSHAEMLFTPKISMSHTCLVFHLEGMALAALREISDLMGGERPVCQLDCGFPEPAHVDRYQRELAGVRVRFGYGSPSSVKLRICADPRALRIKLQDKNALDAAEARCRALIERAAKAGRFADWVAMTLREVSDALPTLDELAASINLSRRTMNRYLAREGTSFREISVRVQHELARERLTERGMSVTEVAYSLGFDNPANFSRAFRNREGCSPGQYQRRVPIDNDIANDV